MLKFFFCLFLFIIFQFKPSIGFAFDTSDPSVSLLQNRISFSYNPQKKWIAKSDLANQISLQVVNDCGWSFGLIGKEGVDYFKSYFLEIYEKTTPDKNFSR